MNELKKTFKAIDPQIKLIIWAFIAIGCWVLYGVLDIVKGTNGFQMFGDADILPYGTILLIVANISMFVLPFVAIALALMKKKIIALPAYIYAGVAFFILVFFDFKQVAGIFWLPFILSLAFAFLGYLINNDKVELTPSK